MTIAVEYVDLPGGVRLPYVEQGAATSIPVVLLHGFAGSWRSFELVLAHLPTSIRAFALTQRGHGEASHPQHGYRVADFSRDLADFMDALRIESAVIVGHSMGSAVAQRFALDHPDRTRALVLVGGSIPAGANPELRAYFDANLIDLTDPVDPALVHGLVASALAQPVPEAFYETMVRDGLKVPARVWKQAFAARLETDLTDEIVDTPASTLLVWGDRDARSSLRDQEALLAALPHANLVVYRGAGHDLHCEEPARFAAELAAFVADVTSAPTTG